MSHRAQLQALHEEKEAWKTRCLLAESAAKDAYSYMHEEMYPSLLSDKKNVRAIDAAVRVSARLYPTVYRTWDADFRKWF